MKTHAAKREFAYTMVISGLGKMGTNVDATYTLCR